MDDERRQRRLDRVGHAIRIELAIGFMAPVVVAFLLVTAPGTIGGGWFHPWWVTLLPWIGGAGVLFGLAWLVRLSRPDPERGEVDWRYHDVRAERVYLEAHDAGRNYEARRRRLDRARYAIRAELTIGVALTLLTGFLWIATPEHIGGPPTLQEPIAPLVAIGMSIAGLVAMFWLSRPRVEAGERDWRYRDF